MPRLIYALFPALNPESPKRKQLTPRMFWFIAIGLSLVALVNLLIAD